MTHDTSQYQLLSNSNLETEESVETLCSTTEHTFWYSTGSSASPLTINDIQRGLAMWHSRGYGSRGIWKALSNERSSGFITLDEVIDFSHADHLSRFKMWQTLPCEWMSKPDPESVLELECVQRFKKLPQVQSIYTNAYMRRKQFLILTSNEKYDDQLMDQLLSTEFDLRTAYGQIPARFVYVPRLFESLNEVVPSESKLIYERDLDVIIHGPLAPSQTQPELGYPVT
jgi:hypothetical protein